MQSYKNVYTADEYKRLEELKDAALEQNGIFKQQRDKAIGDLARHAQTIVDIQNEKLVLLQQIERTIDEKKVRLPWDVANALKALTDAKYSTFGIMHHGNKPEYAEDHHDELRIIQTFCNTTTPDDQPSNGDLIILALVNGYTVELEPRDKVKQLIEKWYAVPGDVTDAELYDLSDGIIDLLQKTS
ncbi:hypothetical protein J23TS9_06480 [Paenibacillus sp. J23TS9]|uniref:hypothetical protein n=1 Tax=Paenibacillus sp. J23TS9 TaxID=2807193 RepID=UPI001B2EC8FA|nr:hypothetical protein [Paenibacillus sp. J23TS9]GIP25518.1 hypothetical protein J23TS9_06480 [Paenibacillus sp. J23TS9]